MPGPQLQTSTNMSTMGIGFYIRGNYIDRSTRQEKEARVRHMSQEKGKHESGKNKARVRKKQSTSQEKAARVRKKHHESGKRRHESRKRKARVRIKKARVRKKRTTIQEKESLS